MKTFLIILTAFFFTLVSNANSFRVVQKINHTTNEVHILDVQTTLEKPKTLRELPYYIVEGHGTDTKTIYKEEVKNSLNPSEKNFLLRRVQVQTLDLSSTEVRELVTDGPATNRIHLTILGDGYTAKEKEKFFADAKRITDNLFTDNTFSSYLPLFQVHAIFVPSVESGIGDGSPINTAFQLYRMPKGSKRAIYPGNEQALESALKLVARTDYPIVIANDEYYGGLGGRYAISTRSEKSGMIVLRHELGHNFGEVGEEYDGGSVYSGANSSRDGKASQWAHWKEDQKIYEAKFLSGNYVWQNLKGKPYRTSFKASAGETLGLELSTVGWSSPDDVHVFVNGLRIHLGGSYHDDRNFYVIDNLSTQVGQNNLEIKENILDGDNVLATAFLYAYPQGFNFKPNVTAAFATYGDFGKTYRPTHDGCLMRNMKLKHFCAVDQENMWHKFLNRVSLIDQIKVEADKISVFTPKLNGLTVKWFDQDGSEFIFLRNQIEASKNIFEAGQKVKVTVELSTPEVRKYDAKFSAAKWIQL
jgi:hypothetical protein